MSVMVRLTFALSFKINFGPDCGVLMEYQTRVSNQRSVGSSLTACRSHYVSYLGSGDFPQLGRSYDYSNSLMNSQIPKATKYQVT